MCNGLIVPVVAFDQIYSFDTDGFLAAIPRPDGIAARSALYRSTIMYRRTAASPAVTGLRPAQDPCDVTCGPSDDYVANPYDCGSFYQCSNGVPTCSNARRVWCSTRTSSLARYVTGQRTTSAHRPARRDTEQAHGRKTEPRLVKRAATQTPAGTAPRPSYCR